MARTEIKVNDPLAVKRYSGNLFFEAGAKSFFSPRLAGEGSEAEMPIQILSDLESDAGEEITYDLLAELTMAPIEGEDTLEGKEEKQRFYSDSVYIDQARCGVNTGGRMTRKRTLHNLRERAKRQQSGWWARVHDELMFMYLSGARGDNDYLFSEKFKGRANNPIVAPDANHHLFGGDATAFNNIDANDKMTLNVIMKARGRAITQGGGTTGVPVMQPCRIGGEDVFVFVMSSEQEEDLRHDIGVGGWLELQKAGAGALGKSSPLFLSALGMHRNVILHSHKRAVMFEKAGAAGNVRAARALFMGAQAGVMAYGSPGTNLKFGWHEETRDNGDKVVISTSSIFGCKKTTFVTEAGPQDFGVIAVDTASTKQ